MKRRFFKKLRARIFGGIVVSACVAAATGAYFFFFADSSLVGEWERVGIVATDQHLVTLTAPEREQITQQFNVRVLTEQMSMQFFEDGTGVRTMTTSGNQGRHTFDCSSSDGVLTTVEGGVFNVLMEYSISGLTNSRLEITTFNADGVRWEVWEFRRAD